MGDRPYGAVKLVIGNLLIAGLYFVVSLAVSEYFRSYDLFPAPIWPGASVALVAAMVAGPWLYLGIFLGSLTSNFFLFDSGLGVAAAISVTNALGPGLAAWLIRSTMSESLPFFRFRDVVAFISFGVILHAFIVATGGAAALHWGVGVPLDALVSPWLRWLLADAGGALFFAPAVLLWGLDRSVWRDPRDCIENFVVSGLTLLATAILFFAPPPETETLSDIAYLLLVPFAWLTVRFSPRDAYTLFTLAAVLAIAGTVTGQGPFNVAGADRPLVLLGLFMVTVSANILTVGALVNERREAERALLMSNADLERRIEERTAELADSEERFRLIVETTPFPLVLARSDNQKVLYVNQRASDLFGVSQDDAIGRCATDYFVEPSDRAALIRAMRDRGFVRDVEVRLSTEQRGEFWALLSVATVPYRDAPALLVGVNDISLRKAYEERLRILAETDALTGIANRRRFMDIFQDEFARAKRYGRPFSVIIADIDHFKDVNDTHGHAAGDALLKRFSDECQYSLRQQDFLGRIGGEEFAVLLPETDSVRAAEVAEKLRGHIEQMPFAVTDSGEIKVTASFGVAEIAHGDLGMDSMMARADAALYRAKNDGRNKVAAG